MSNFPFDINNIFPEPKPSILDSKDLSSLLRNFQHADYQYEIIMKSIKEFESELDDEHEVAVKLASFGQSVLLNVTSIGYSNPSLIHFYGYVNGSPAELIQNVNQLNFLITSTKKEDPSKEPRRIGFDLEDT